MHFSRHLTKFKIGIFFLPSVSTAAKAEKGRRGSFLEADVCGRVLQETGRIAENGRKAEPGLKLVAGRKALMKD